MLTAPLPCGVWLHDGTKARAADTIRSPVFDGGDGLRAGVWLLTAFPAAGCLAAEDGRAPDGDIFIDCLPGEKASAQAAADAGGAGDRNTWGIGDARGRCGLCSNMPKPDDIIIGPPLGPAPAARPLPYYVGGKNSTRLVCRFCSFFFCDSRELRKKNPCRGGAAAAGRLRQCTHGPRHVQGGVRHSPRRSIQTNHSMAASARCKEKGCDPSCPARRKPCPSRRPPPRGGHGKGLCAVSVFVRRMGHLYAASGRGARVAPAGPGRADADGRSVLLAAGRAGMRRRSF